MDYQTQLPAQQCAPIGAQLQQAAQRSTQHRRVLLAVVFIENNLHLDPSLAEVAAAVSLSLRGFSDLFKDVTGLPPARYIKLLKMETARRHLSCGFPSISEVMEKVGIKDASHFSRDFKKFYGMCPLQYRDRYPRDLNNRKLVGEYLPSTQDIYRQLP